MFQILTAFVLGIITAIAAQIITQHHRIRSRSQRTAFDFSDWYPIDIDPGDIDEATEI